MTDGPIYPVSMLPQTANEVYYAVSSAFGVNQDAAIALTMDAPTGGIDPQAHLVFDFPRTTPGGTKTLLVSVRSGTAGDISVGARAKAVNQGQDPSATVFAGALVTDIVTVSPGDEFKTHALTLAFPEGSIPTPAIGGMFHIRFFMDGTLSTTTSQPFYRLSLVWR